jgi:hypothetical protein
MSDTVLSADNEGGVVGGRDSFNGRTIFIIIAAGVLAFMGFIVLSAFAPQMDGRSNGGAHAMSVSGNGYKAIAELTERSGLGGDVLRKKEDAGWSSLLVITPDEKSSSEDIWAQIEAHQGKGKVLIVPEKWSVRPLPSRRGWVQKNFASVMQYVVPEEELGVDLKWEERTSTAERMARDESDIEPYDIPVPTTSFAVEGADLNSVIAHPGGGNLVAYIDTSPGVYILADADLLNNQAMDDPKKAEAAVRLLTSIVNYDNLREVQFDVTLNGLGEDDRSLLRMAFTPPFLAITLCLIAAAIFAGWQSVIRYGPQWRSIRAVALGKSALVGNAAELMRQAGKEHHGAGIYARNMRDTVASALSAPPQLKDDALNDWLDRRAPRGTQPIGELMRRMERADTGMAMLEGARALARWRKEILRDH